MEEYLKRGSQLLDIQEKELSYFERIDYFNEREHPEFGKYKGDNSPDYYKYNVIRGVISRRADHRYGALVIFEINEDFCENIIWCTPKLKYPWNKAGEFNWPVINQLEVWSKIDGTNILSFHYWYKGKKYTTYKTRLSPILANSQFGLFKSMWEEYLSENSWVKEVIEANPNYNLSFEMYGSRNPITVQYDVPLEAALLFGVRKEDGAIRPPSQLNIDGAKVAYNFVVDPNNPTEAYNGQRAEMSERNNGELKEEGMVFYVHTGQPSWEMFKCKPEEIESIHWAASGFIPKNALWTTLLNAFEEQEEPTKEYVRELLLEEFTDQQIQKSIPRIKKLYYQAKNHIEITKSINEVWLKAKAEGFDVTVDKAATFRFMSQFFKKDQMKKVASIILKQAGLL